MTPHFQDVDPRNNTELVQGEDTGRAGDMVPALRNIVQNEIQGSEKAVYSPVQIQCRIGCLKPTELNPMPCYNLKAGFVLPCKAEFISHFSNGSFLPSAPRDPKAYLSSLSVPSQSCTASNWSPRPMVAILLIAFESALHQSPN